MAFARLPALNFSAAFNAKAFLGPGVGLLLHWLLLLERPQAMTVIGHALRPDEVISNGNTLNPKKDARNLIDRACFAEFYATRSRTLLDPRCPSPFEKTSCTTRSIAIQAREPEL